MADPVQTEPGRCVDQFGVVAVKLCNPELPGTGVDGDLLLVIKRQQLACDPTGFRGFRIDFGSAFQFSKLYLSGTWLIRSRC
jgi:hypothetical protein